MVSPYYQSRGNTFESPTISHSEYTLVHCKQGEKIILSNKR